MSVSNPVFKPRVSTGGKTIVITQTITSGGAATFTLPLDTRAVIFRSRTPCELKFYTTLGGDFITVKPHCVLRLDGLELIGQDLYIESSIAVTIIEALITQG